VDQALFAVVMEAYLHGVSTRKVNDLVKWAAAVGRGCRPDHTAITAARAGCCSISAEA
jgi:hypothetical protein